MTGRARSATVALGLAALLVSPVQALAQPATPASAEAVAAAPADSEALALAREIIRVGFPEDKRAAMFFGVVDAMTGQMRSVTLARFNNDPAAKAIMDRNIDRFIAASKPIINRHIPALLDAQAQGYAHEFSVSELRELLAFVRTPAGGHFFLRNSAVMADPAFAAANQAYIRDLQPQMDLLRQNVTNELMGHYAAHPPKSSAGS